MTKADPRHIYTANYYVAIFVAILSFSRFGQCADLPRFEIHLDQIANVILDATPGDPWIFSITLTESALKDYNAFSAAHVDDQISLIVAGTEIYRPTIRESTHENPITFRMFDKKKYLSILSAFPDDPE